MFPLTKLQFDLHELATELWAILPQITDSKVHCQILDLVPKLQNWGDVLSWEDLNNAAKALNCEKEMGIILWEACDENTGASDKETKRLLELREWLSDFREKFPQFSKVCYFYLCNIPGHVPAFSVSELEEIARRSGVQDCWERVLQYAKTSGMTEYSNSDLQVTLWQLKEKLVEISCEIIGHNDYQQLWTWVHEISSWMDIISENDIQKAAEAVGLTKEAAKIKIQNKAIVGEFMATRWLLNLASWLHDLGEKFPQLSPICTEYSGKIMGQLPSYAGWELERAAEKSGLGNALERILQELEGKGSTAKAETASSGD
jgi:hypothetical protein